MMLTQPEAKYNFGRNIWGSIVNIWGCVKLIIEIWPGAGYNFK